MRHSWIDWWGTRRWYFWFACIVKESVISSCPKAINIIWREKLRRRVKSGWISKMETDRTEILSTRNFPLHCFNDDTTLISFHFFFFCLVRRRSWGSSTQVFHPFIFYAELFVWVTIFLLLSPISVIPFKFLVIKSELESDYNSKNSHG